MDKKNFSLEVTVVVFPPLPDGKLTVRKINLEIPLDQAFQAQESAVALARPLIRGTVDEYLKALDLELTEAGPVPAPNGKDVREIPY